jgi:hypothetical protein
MVPAGLFCLGWDGAEAVLAEPDGCACRACGYATDAEQLQHSLAPGEAMRLFRCLIGFPGHGHPPLLQEYRSVI